MLTEQPNPKTADIDRLSTLEMLNRINEQDQQVAVAVNKVLPEIGKAVDAITEQMRQGGRLIYVGAGTSGRLGVLDAVECVPTFGTPPGLVVGLIAGGDRALTTAVEGAEDDVEQARTDLERLNLNECDVVVGIAASGRTPYVLGAVETANAIGCKTVGLSCNVPSPLLEVAEIAIGVVVGPEVITGSTRLKAGTAQKMVLNMVSTAVMVKLGKVYGNLMVDVQVTNAKLKNRAFGLVKHLTGLDDATAATLLESSEQSVKAAVVMYYRSVDLDEATALLADAGGNLRAVIGDV